MNNTENRDESADQREHHLHERFAALLEFIRTFVRYALHIRETIALLILVKVFAGLVFAKLEGVNWGDGIYFALITGMSIGYGDITPKTAAGKILSVSIGLVGMLFVGVTVAVANRALADTVKRYSKTGE